MKNFISILSIFIIVSCSSGKTPVEEGLESQILHWGNGSEPQGIDPHIVTGVPEHHILIGVCEGLTITDPKGGRENLPGVAESWTLKEDQKTYVFNFNPNARWSDGQEVTADDVIASYDIRMDETILMPSTQITYGKIERPEAISKYIVKVKSKNLNWRNMLYFGGMVILPEHYLKDLDGTAYLEEYNFKMLPGTGPYLIRDEDIINQESYSLVRRDDWWSQDHPTNRYMYNFDRITVSVVKDNPTLEFEKMKKVYF